MTHGRARPLTLVEHLRGFANIEPLLTRYVSAKYGFNERDARPAATADIAKAMSRFRPEDQPRAYNVLRTEAVDDASWVRAGGINALVLTYSHLTPDQQQEVRDIAVANVQITPPLTAMHKSWDEDQGSYMNDVRDSCAIASASFRLIAIAVESMSRIAVGSLIDEIVDRNHFLSIRAPVNGSSFDNSEPLTIAMNTRNEFLQMLVDISKFSNANGRRLVVLRTVGEAMGPSDDAFPSARNSSIENLGRLIIDSGDSHTSRVIDFLTGVVRNDSTKIPFDVGARGEVAKRRHAAVRGMVHAYSQLNDVMKHQVRDVLLDLYTSDAQLRRPIATAIAELPRAERRAFALASQLSR